MHDAGGINHAGVRMVIVSRKLVGSLQEGIQAVRDKASFLEGELRGQLADARGALEAERAQRRAVEAALAQQLRQAQSEAAALQAGRAFAREAQEQQQVRLQYRAFCDANEQLWMSVGLPPSLQTKAFTKQRARL